MKAARQKQTDPKLVRYLWCEVGHEDQMYGLRETLAETLADAQKTAGESQSPIEIQVFDCRPATAADRELFENDEESGVDVEAVEWWRDCWVPENEAWFGTVTAALAKECVFFVNSTDEGVGFHANSRRSAHQWFDGFLDSLESGGPPSDVEFKRVDMTQAEIDALPQL